MTKVKGCTCTHEWQDKKYGKERPLMDATSKGSGKETFRCTVYKNEQ